MVDTVPTLVDPAALADSIQSTEAVLTTVFITHSHLDHYLGAAKLLERFPDARVIATEATVRHIENEVRSGAERATYAAMFMDELPSTVIVPEVIQGDRLELEGHDDAYLEQADRLLAENPSAAEFVEQILKLDLTRLITSTLRYGAAAPGLR